ncbi:MAG: hypothetical protein WAV46_02900 [Candidatus Moraniibacteriota bacterium]
MKANKTRKTRVAQPSEESHQLFRQVCRAIVDMRAKRTVATFQVFLQRYRDPADLEAIAQAKYLCKVTDTELAEWQERYDRTYAPLTA